MSLRIYGNRSLKTVPGEGTRPTTGRVREAVFNILQGQVLHCTWLDLCAGNGVMGAEALCRGAAAVVGIEASGLACRTIRDNWQRVSQPHQTYRVMRGDVLTCLPRLQGEQFDLIYFDPPYQSGLYQPVLAAIAHQHLLRPTGQIIAEHDHHWGVELPVAGLVCHRQKRYGRTQLSFFQREQA
ncbi:MAG: 16S rRNA (guanine(966)-N(2))-methyltransferase RsmD [Leptolyngbya sp.]|nr:16S rRNA (guanine(966)-N(2))-methyltransferase RsmD [Leptolyngbya sp.]